MDLASLVTGGSGKKSAYDELASSIGKDVYIDVSGWWVVPQTKLKLQITMWGCY